MVGGLVAVLLAGVIALVAPAPPAHAATTAPPAPASAPTSSVPTSAPSTTKGGPPPTVFANDPGQTVSAVVGQTVALRVQTNPSTDFGWDVVRHDQDKLFDMGASYDDAGKGASSAVPGRPVTQNLLFRATAPGTATVVLRYGRPDAPSPSDVTVTFTIAIA
jgi:predicted secreted protein